eukprot:CAMPEP_0115740964 /NCGR_PEP_ID=MMETSP0272-20121206/89758_1 /TAXON_ID=71861 /ORGANISM="Scrippsiella trochoidea, Strain CCMP3099" /LENGTH=96 /DNA_ID=CAMNT_0003185621 /DNA_START=67 /DNA_END=357 /DNA_ORIENTATION=+
MPKNNFMWAVSANDSQSAVVAGRCHSSEDGHRLTSHSNPPRLWEKNMQNAKKPKVMNSPPARLTSSFRKRKCVTSAHGCMADSLWLALSISACKSP